MQSVSEVMSLISHGVYVIGVSDSKRNNLMTAAWLSQVSSKPPMLSVAVSKKHYTTELLEDSKTFSVSVLTEDQRDTAMRCGSVSGREKDKLACETVEYSEEGLPVIKKSAGYMICEIKSILEAGDHYMFVAEVIDGRSYSDNVMLYKKSVFL